MEKMHLSVPLHGEYLQQGEGKHTWKFTASCGAPFSQKISYIGCVMGDIPDPGKYW